jgi:predicted transcriptional regulator
MRTFKPAIRQSKPETRRYAVLPAKSIQDDDLHPTTLRVLGAISLHTNKYGICWPSRITIGRHVSRTPKTVSMHVTRLIKLGYIRKLTKRGYKIPGWKRNSRYATNRYQVLYDGLKTAMPSKEEFYAPRPKIAEEYPEEQVIENSRGFKGVNKQLISIISQAFCSGVQKASGVSRNVQNQYKDAESLADKGVTGEEVEEAAANMTLERMKEGRDPPISLNQVAIWAGLQ